MSARALFWVVIAAALLHTNALGFGILAVAYFACTAFDHWRANKATKKVIKALDDETDGWEADPDDPEKETKGNFTRIRLSNKEAILVNRVAEVLREMERARLYDLP